MIDPVSMEDRDTKGDLYEYMLGNIATAGQNGQLDEDDLIIAPDEAASSDATLVPGFRPRSSTGFVHLSPRVPPGNYRGR